MTRKTLILAATAAAAALVLSAKLMRRPPAAVAPAAQSRTAAGPTLYLFLDDRDHDAGCEGVYAAFERERAALPPGVAAARVDVGRDPELAKRLGVRLLPTILLVGADGAEAGRVEGEGEEVEGRLRHLVAGLGNR